MWSKLLLISDKKYDLDWIREERELIDAARYNDNLSEENQKHYDLLQVVRIQISNLLYHH